jgi:CHAT domain-containing protein
VISSTPRDRVDDAIARARARRVRARALSYVGRFEEAITDCLDAVEIAGAAGLVIEAGRARLASMHALGELGRLDEAIDVGEQARRDFLRIDEPGYAARADINIGISHLRQDRPRAALTSLDRARPAVADEPPILGHLENSRGEALVLVHRFDEAGEAFDRALHIFESVGAELTAAIAEGNLADLAAREGRLDHALRYFESARRRLERSKAPTHLARLVAEQAEVKGTLGLPLEALDEYETALPELDRCGLALEAARARSGMGGVLMRLERIAAAETALAAAATGFDELGHATARARVDLLRAELALRHGRPAEALRIATRSMSALGDRPADLAACRLLLARIAVSRGDDETAEAELAGALAAARRLDLAPLLADILADRGRLRRRRGAVDAAREDLRSAVGHIERVRGSLQADRLRAAFLGRRANAYAALVDALLEGGEREALDEAFGVIERAKSRSLLEQIEADLDEPALAGDVDPEAGDLRAALLRARSDLNALYSRLADDGGAGTPGVRSAWTSAVSRREREYAQIETRLLAARPAGAAATPVTLDEARSRLDERTALLEYFITDDSVVTFAVRRDAIVARRLPCPMSEIADHVERLRFQVDRALRPGAQDSPRAHRRLADARAALGELHDAILAPVLDACDGVDRLCVIPHGGLHFVPFAALWDGARHLIETHAVHVAPSASLLGARGGSEQNVTGAPLIVGVGDERAPGMVAEAQAVAARVDCPPDRLLLEDEATAAAFAHLAPSATMIHLACHGRFVPDAPQASGLLLADRWMTARDVAALRLRARLVTLSACETGRHLVEAGDELIGLVRSLLVAGAESLILSLWRVDDETARELMEALNTLVSGGTGDIIDALRQAQLATMSRRPHPAFWAGFTLVGAP